MCDVWCDDASLNSSSLSKATWYSLTQEVWKAIETVKDDRDDAYTQQLLAANQPLVVAADGAWSHPSHTAGQHEWCLMNTADKKAICNDPAGNEGGEVYISGIKEGSERSHMKSEREQQQRQRCAEENTQTEGIQTHCSVLLSVPECSQPLSQLSIQPSGSS